jgi:hypothetical protein
MSQMHMCPESQQPDGGFELTTFTKLALSFHNLAIFTAALAANTTHITCLNTFLSHTQMQMR